MPPHLNAAEQQCCIPLGYIVSDFCILYTHTHTYIYLYIFIYIYLCSNSHIVCGRTARGFEETIGGLRAPQRALGQKGEK